MNATGDQEIQAVLDFWFAPEVAKHWFASTPALDADIRQRFEPLWRRAAAGECDAWADSAAGALALIIVLDQFPLNMFRGEAAAFSTEQHAVQVTRQALAHNFHLTLSCAPGSGDASEPPPEGAKPLLGRPGERLENDQQRLFLFLPLMHSENLNDQDASVELFKAAGMETRWAEHHRQIVQRFGRFPHRNGSLGRVSTPEEMAYLASDAAFKG